MTNKDKDVKIGDVFNNRQVIQIGWNNTRAKAMFVVVCLKCGRKREVPRDRMLANGCKQCRYNSLKTHEKFHRIYT